VVGFVVRFHTLAAQQPRVNPEIGREHLDLALGQPLRPALAHEPLEIAIVAAQHPRQRGERLAVFDPLAIERVADHLSRVECNGHIAARYHQSGDNPAQG